MFDILQEPSPASNLLQQLPADGGNYLQGDPETMIKLMEDLRTPSF